MYKFNNNCQRKPNTYILYTPMVALRSNINNVRVHWELGHLGSARINDVWSDKTSTTFTTLTKEPNLNTLSLLY